MDRNSFRRRSPRATVTVNRRTKALAFFLLLISPLAAKESISFHETNLKDWKRTNAVLDLESGKRGSLHPIENTPKTGEFFLDFEGDELLSEDAAGIPSLRRGKPISVVSSSYITDSKHSVFGKKSAYFSGNRNQIHLNVLGSHLFGSDPESFSITLPLLISEQGASSVVMERTVFIKGKKFGFSLELDENKPVFHINNLIQKDNGTTVSTVLYSSVPLPRKQWHTVSAYFDSKEKSLYIYQNGYQTAKYEAHDKDVTGIGFPESDTTNLIIGKSFFGNIDGFHIHRGEPYFPDDYSRYARVNFRDDNKMASHNGSWAISPVYASQFSHSTLLKFEADMDKPKDTQINFYFRGSNQKFVENAPNIPEWTRLDISSPIPASLQKFKFHQWKVWLRSDPMGKSAPSIYSVNYNLKEQLPPLVPSGFRLDSQESNQRAVCFLWNSNHEREVQDKGGYVIYYGIKPDRMIGSLFLDVSSPEKHTIINGNQTRYCVNNETIISNIYVPEHRNSSLPNTVANPKFASRMEKRGALFQSGITYYFKIGSYNSYFDEWEGRDEKSGLSPAISVSFPKEISQR